MSTEPEYDSSAPIPSTPDLSLETILTRGQFSDPDTYNYDDVPTVRQFALNNKRIRALMGCFGSGKSSGCLMEIIRRGHMQAPSFENIRRTRWAIVRNCYDDQTEILTEKRSWQLFRNLLPDDRVATLIDGKIVYRRPDKVVKFPYTGEMLGFESEAVDFLVTPDHKMWVSKRRTRKKVWGDFEVLTAGEIYGNQLIRVRKDADWAGVDPGLSLAVFEWLGFWFAEGSYGVYGREERIVVSQNKPLGIAYTHDLFKRAGINYTLRGGRQFVVKMNTPLFMRLKVLVENAGKAIVKKVPLEILSAPKQHLQAFLRGFIMGDGFVCNGTTRMCTSSATLADNLQEIALKAGEVINIGKPEDRIGQEVRIGEARGKVNALHYKLTLLKKSHHRPYLHITPKDTNHLKGWHKIDYSGMVYCVEMDLVPVYVRRNKKAFWCMRSYRQLLDTTIKTVHDWFPPGRFGVWKITEHEYRITAFEGIEIELLFRALDRPDQVGNLLSLELTGAWLNEVREIPREIFEAIDGRIGRYPPERAEGCTWKGVMMDTNPPDDSSWFYKYFEEERPSNARLFKQPSGLSPQAENLKNLPKGYYRELAKGKSERFIDVYIHGKYGYSYEGKAVFQENFDDSKHIASHVLEPDPQLPLVLGFDFGLNPTCLIGQHSRRGQLRILSEYVSDGMGLKQFCMNVLLPTLHTKYADFRILGGGADPAGKKRQDTDETTCFQTLRSSEINIRNIYPASTNAYVPRFEAVDHFLTKMVGGEPGLIISPNCKYLRKGFNGAYRFKRLGDGFYSDSPEKNITSHPMESLQYLCMWLINRKDTDMRFKSYDEYMKYQRRQMERTIPAGGY